jgi:hypothetical protein
MLYGHHAAGRTLWPLLAAIAALSSISSRANSAILSDDAGKSLLAAIALFAARPAWTLGADNAQPIVTARSALARLAVHAIFAGQPGKPLFASITSFADITLLTLGSGRTSLTRRTNFAFFALRPSRPWITLWSRETWLSLLAFFACDSWRAVCAVLAIFAVVQFGKPQTNCVAQFTNCCVRLDCNRAQLCDRCLRLRFKQLTLTLELFSLVGGNSCDDNANSFFDCFN